MVRQIFLPLFLLASLLLSGIVARAQKDRLEGLWYNEEKSARIRIFRATDKKFYGKIDWLKVPEADGAPRKDGNNPDAKKRGQPLLGLVILKGFHPAGENLYEGGTIYDPKNGKTYSCKITYKGNVLDVRGYVGISLIGRTTTWTRAE